VNKPRRPLFGTAKPAPALGAEALHAASLQSVALVPGTPAWHAAAKSASKTTRK
jgi:hypothetical protein